MKHHPKYITSSLWFIYCAFAYRIKKQPHEGAACNLHAKSALAVLVRIILRGTAVIRRALRRPPVLLLDDIGL